MEGFKVIQRNRRSQVAEIRNRITSSSTGSVSDVWKAYDENENYRLATGDDPDAIYVVEYDTKTRNVGQTIARLYADMEDGSQEMPEETPDAPESHTEESVPAAVAETREETPETLTEPSESLADTPTETAPETAPASRYVMLISITSATAGTGVTHSPDAPEVIVHRDTAGWHVSSGDHQTNASGVETAASAMASTLGLKGPGRIVFEYMDEPFTLDFTV